MLEVMVAAKRSAFVSTLQRIAAPLKCDWKSVLMMMHDKSRLKQNFSS